MAESLSGKAECEGRFRGGMVNGVAMRGSPLKAKRDPIFSDE